MTKGFCTSAKYFILNIMRIWGGGWIKEDQCYTINAQQVKKELKHPTKKKTGRSRSVFVFDDLP